VGIGFPGDQNNTPGWIACQPQRSTSPRNPTPNDEYIGYFHDIWWRHPAAAGGPIGPADLLFEIYSNTAASGPAAFTRPAGWA